MPYTGDDMDVVVEAPTYLKAAKAAGMTEAEMKAAALLVSADPEAGDLMIGTGGCRKVRLAGKGKGSSREPDPTRAQRPERSYRLL